MNYIKLSYDINRMTPLYPNTKRVSITGEKSIAKGDSSNTFILEFSNHSGTHMDAPRHFSNRGRSVADYALDELVFKRPVLVDLRKRSGDPIDIEDLEDQLYKAEKPDFLMIRTGFSRYRDTNSRLYCRKNPYLSPAAAAWIRSKFPSIRAIAIDCISVASYSNRQAGRKTHSILLTSRGFKGKPVLIIEDLYIPRAAGKFKKIIAVPIFVKEIDSAPCTVIGLTHD